MIPRHLLQFPVALTYMLQSTEYEPREYLLWFWRTQDFSQVMNRRSLEKTGAAKLFLLFLWGGMAVQIMCSIGAIFYGGVHADWVWVVVGAIGIVLTPLVWAHLVIIPTLLARECIVKPRLEKLRRATHEILSKHPGTKIAIAGSYGKTTTKEILATVLAQGKKVAATPANKNVASSHYQFAKSLEGDEDIIILELGEGKPGDVRGFAETLVPDMGIITGVAPAHLDQYGSTEAAAKDIFELAHYLGGKHVYVNGESPAAQPFIMADYLSFSEKGVGEWQASDIKIDIQGMAFTLEGPDKIELHTQLIGRHLIGVLTLAVVIAKEMGLTAEEIKAGIAATAPYEHRMQPYRLHGAWVIDDAYNGNIEGIRAGARLLAELEARRKIYVTPGLVDQGKEVEAVHRELGHLVAGANPDMVVLMKNSVTDHIRRGLDEAGYSGSVRIETNPLQFYTHLDQFVAAGDLIMLQNDWTDNYN